MRVARALLVAALLPGMLYGAQSPEIEVVDGKISMSVEAMPLGRLLGLLDRVMGTTSEVKPELANRNISTQFTQLEFKDAVRKIFQGQPLNYMVIEGRGIRVTDVAVGGGTTAAAPSPSSNPFQDSQPFNNPSLPPPSFLQPPPQAGIPQNPNNPTTITPFGPRPDPNAVNQNQNSTAPMIAPGQMPPPLGMNNPMISPAGGGNMGGVNSNGGISVPPSAPSAPGTIGGATPGTIGR